MSMRGAFCATKQSLWVYKEIASVKHVLSAIEENASQ